MAEEDTKTDFRRGFLLPSSLTQHCWALAMMWERNPLSPMPLGGMPCGYFVVVVLVLFVLFFLFFFKYSELGVESTGLA